MIHGTYEVIAALLVLSLTYGLGFFFGYRKGRRDK